MNTQSRFNKKAAVAAIVGAKSNSDVRAELTFERQANRVTLNAMASDLMKVKAGMYLKVFVNPDAEDINARFAIAVVSEEVGGAAKVAQVGDTPSVGRPCAFNYAGVWSQAYQFDPKSIAVGSEAMVDKGLMQEYTTTLNEDGSTIVTVLGKTKVSFGLELDEEGAGEIDGVAYDQLFYLVDGAVIPLGEPAVTDKARAKAAKEAIKDTIVSNAPKAKKGEVL